MILADVGDTVRTRLALAHATEAAAMLRKSNYRHAVDIHSMQSILPPRLRRCLASHAALNSSAASPYCSFSRPLIPTARPSTSGTRTRIRHSCTTFRKGQAMAFRARRARPAASRPPIARPTTPLPPAARGEGSKLREVRGLAATARPLPYPMHREGIAKEGRAGRWGMCAADGC
jgi:hypothetical protein